VIGESVGRFRILRELGAGGMGVVYAAHDPSLGREVAIKVLPEDALGDESARSRLLREARLAATLNHPNVCTVYDVGESGRRVFIAMELVPGEPLSARAGRALDVGRVLRYGQQIAGALEHAHARHVIHRDLKSANVVITPDERVKVLDFGVATHAGGSEGPTLPFTARLTVPGTIVGTPSYLAPEVLRGEPADARSDLWALGVMLYEMAAGRLPFAGESGFALAACILNETPAPLPSAVPAGLRAVIQRCLEKEPARRYRHAGEVGAALAALRSAGAKGDAARGRRSPAPATLALAAGGILAVLALVLDLGGVRARLIGGPAEVPVRSLAVLPLANLSRDPGQDYFADGMTEMLIASLSQVRGLDVISRTSAMRYRGTDRTLRQIADELHVDAALEGAVMTSAGRVRLTVKLVRVAGERSLWAQAYERDLKDVLSLQNELAAAVAREIRIALSPAEARNLAPRGEVDPLAYEYYLRGRYELDRRTPDGLSKAERYFHQVASRVPGAGPPERPTQDSDGRVVPPPSPLPPAAPGSAAARTGALGLTGLADVSITRAIYGAEPPDRAYERARGAATRALELDTTLAEAHVSMGAVLEAFDWNRPGAEREYLLAIDLNPNLVEARRSYALFLMRTGRMDEAIVHIRRALKLDPASARAKSLLGTWYLFSRRFDESIRELSAALELDASSAVICYWRGVAHAKNRSPEKAIADLEKAIEWSGGNPGAIAGLACAHALAGQRAQAVALLAKLDAIARKAYVAPSAYAFVRASLGEEEEAFEWLRKAHEARDNAMAGLAVEPWLEPLHGDPRFEALLGSVGLGRPASPAARPKKRAAGLGTAPRRRGLPGPHRENLPRT
jgi:serine/threonine-protein kinase